MSPSRQRRKAQPAHTDDWLMTYADMITLLLCFFAIIIITSSMKKNVSPVMPLVPPVVEQRPEPVPPTPPPPVSSSPVSLLDIFPGNLPFHDVAQNDLDDADMTVKTDAPVQAEKVENAAPAAPVPPESAPTLPQIAEDLKARGPAAFEQKGDRITTLEINSAAFFGSGSAVLSNAGMVILRNVAASLKSDQFKDYQITVEGHTDDTPVHTLQFPSNWELSTARASAVVHFFLDQGVPATKLRAAGYADTFPKLPNRDANGNAMPANQAENRRVVIKLEKIDKNN